MIADYSLSPSTGVNGGGGIGSSSSSNSVSNGYSNINNNNNTSKLVFLNFDDGFQSQYTYAKPILDKYGFKASFFVVCNYAGKPDRMSWQEITTLHNEGYDIESHSMNHNHMNQMTPDVLTYEICVYNNPPWME
jgi:peptidoglycan/xylan/chitin deacetylase (PgdA/CDA1 family)